jgi:hypothetical protein
MKRLNGVYILLKYSRRKREPTRALRFGKDAGPFILFTSPTAAHTQRSSEMQALNSLLTPMYLAFCKCLCRVAKKAVPFLLMFFFIFKHSSQAKFNANIISQVEKQRLIED